MSALGATIIPPSSHVSTTKKNILCFAEGGEIAKVVMNDGTANVEDGNGSQRRNLCLGWKSDP